MPKIKACPKCGTIGSLTKNGRDAKKQQRYKCSSCKKTFLLDNSTKSKLKKVIILLRNLLVTWSMM